MINQLNHHNRLITAEFIREVFAKVNITNVQINDLSNYQLAFVHRSYVRKKNQPSRRSSAIDGVVDAIIEQPRTEDFETTTANTGIDDTTSTVVDSSNIIQFQPESNEILEFVGDSILGNFIARYLQTRYHYKDEGFLTTLKSKLVKTDTLAKFSLFLGFDSYLIISNYVEHQDGRSNTKLLENMFEAFIGAIYQDQGGFDWDPYSLKLAHQFIQGVVEMTIDFVEINLQNDNYKDRLMRAFHQIFRKHADYELIETTGESNNRTFTWGVLHPIYPHIIVSTGTGRSKLQAQQNAAKEALAILDKIQNWNNGSDTS